MSLGLGNNLSKTGLTTPGIVTSNLVLKHNYSAGGVHLVSDGAAYFDGDDDYIAISGLAGEIVTDAAFSFCCWFNCLTSASGENEHQEIMFGAFEADGDNEFRIGVNIASGDTAGGIFCSDDQGSNNSFIISDGSSATNGTKYTDGLWHHLAVTIAAGAGATAAKVYVDGLELTNAYTAEAGAGDGAGDSAVIDAQFSDATQFILGLDLDNGNTLTDEFKGYMCNVGVWSAVLTQAQIKSIMNKNYAGLTSSEKTNLVSWWNLDEGITTDGSVTFALDEHTTTLTTAPNQTWAVQSGSPTVNGQEITFTAGESQQVGCTLSTGAGNYKVNMTVSDYSGSGTISLLWDGGGSSDLRTTGNGTFEWVTYLDSSPNILKDSGAAGKVTVNSIKKYDGNTGEFK